MDGSMRTVIESELFSIQISQFPAHAKDLDLLLGAVIRALSNRPDIFSEVDPQKHIWLVKGIDRVPYRIWYTFTIDTVTLLAIERDERGNDK